MKLEFLLAKVNPTYRLDLLKQKPKDPSEFEIMARDIENIYLVNEAIEQNTQVNPSSFAISNGYPQLARDGSSTPVARIRTYYPNVLTADILYTLGLTGNPVIGFKSKDSRIVFMGLPLHRTNGSPFKIKDFFHKVFFEEFGVSK